MEIQQLILETAELVELEDYYSKVLELPTVTGDGLLDVTVGPSQIRFVRPSVAMVTPYYHFAFNIPENQLEASMDWLAQRCELLRHRGDGDVVFDFQSWNAHSIYFEDPAGNILELIARHNLDNARSGPFGSECLLCVSEIGLPVAHVRGTVTRLEAHLGLPQYRPAADHFAPLGDENGLFIVIGTDRTWLPSEKTPARSFPTQVTIAGQARSLELEGGRVRIDAAR